MLSKLQRVPSSSLSSSSLYRLLPPASRLVSPLPVLLRALKPRPSPSLRLHLPNFSPLLSHPSLSKSYYKQRFTSALHLSYLIPLSAPRIPPLTFSFSSPLTLVLVSRNSQLAPAPQLVMPTMTSACSPVSGDLQDGEIDGRERKRGSEVGSFSVWCWAECEREAMASLYNPFVLMLAAGTLPKETFAHYVAQDSFYLRIFAKMFGLAKSLAADVDMAHELGKMEDATWAELELHSAYAQSYGIDVSGGNVIPSLATLAYTNFLEAIPSSTSSSPTSGTKDKANMARIVAGMIPCMRLYAFLGTEMMGAIHHGRQSVGGSDEEEVERTRMESKWEEEHPYSTWLKTYSSPDFEVFAKKLEDILDALVRSYLQKASTFIESFSPKVLEGDEFLRTLLSLYRTAMLLEAKFFSAQPFPKPLGKFLKWGEREFDTKDLLFLCDFDGTCTEIDSSEILGGIALGLEAEERDRAAQRAENHEQAEADEGSRRKTEKWAELVDTYFDEYKSFMDGALSHEANVDGTHEDVWAEGKKSLTTRTVKPFSEKLLREFLRKLADFEASANERVAASGVLKGIPRNILSAGSARPQFRTGSSNVLRRIADEGGRIHVLSLAWSKLFIEGALTAELKESENESTQALRAAKSIVVHANELEFDKDGMSSGQIERCLEGPLDKERFFINILRSDPVQDSNAAPQEKVTETENGGGTEAGGKLVIFVGDGVADLLPMLRADIGILVGEGSSVKRVAHEFGICISPLCAGALKSRMERPDAMNAEGRAFGSRAEIYEARSWAEIDAFLFPDSGSGSC